MRRITAFFASAVSLLALALFVPACAPVSDVGLTEEPIINGTIETGYPEVVAVYWQMGTSAGGLCTGTVIGPYAILTAKHCVFNENADGSYTLVPAANFYVIETNNIDDTASIDPRTDVNFVYEVRTTAGTNVDNDVSNGRDIAILLLRDPIDITPRAWARTGPSVGDLVDAVGFGRTSSAVEDSAGVKYRGHMRVSMVGSFQILAGAAPGGGGWTCQGDSGGPLINAAGEVVGITSYGFDRSCRIDDSVFVRVAQFGTMITDALTFVPPCTPSGETCNGLDDDCDGTPDDGIGCLDVGDVCTMESECRSMSCEDVHGTMRCTISCLPESPLPCEAGNYCEVTGCGGGRCVPGTRGALLDGATCTTDTDCASGYCPTLRAGRICGTPCCPAAGVFCSDAVAVCDPVPDGDGAGACVPPELAMGPRGFGEVCDEDADCVSNDCATPGGFCTQPCDAATFCPEGFHCGEGTCLRGALGPQGARCAAATDCRPGLECVEGMCATTCTAGGAECPMGTTCVTGGASMVCLPPGAALGEPCMENPDCATSICGGTCTVLCDTVACPTGYECTPVGTLMACFRPRTTAGGCAATPGARHGAAGIALVLGALGLVIARRR